MQALQDRIISVYLRNGFLSYKTEFGLFLVVLENSVLPMDLDSSHATLNMTSVFYKRWDIIPNQYFCNINNVNKSSARLFLS